MESVESSLLIRMTQGIRDTKSRARLACVCKGWRSAVADSWETVQLSFNDISQLETQLAWLLKQLHARPWLLQSIEFRCGQYLAPVSMDLRLGKFSGLTSLNLLCMDDGPTAQKFEQGLQYIWRPSFTLRPDTLESLSCTSGSLQKLWVAFNDDVEHTTLEHFSSLVNLRDLHISLYGNIGNRPVSTTVRLSPKLTALTKLEAFRIRGAGLIAEEQPGLLSELCQHLTYLLLHGEKVSLREPISSPSLQFLSIICPLTHRLPVGCCPELLTLIHSARDVTAADLLKLPMLTTLRDTICSPTNISPDFVMGLQPLSSLQHIQLSQYRAQECGGFEELSIFPALQSMKLMIDNDPHLLQLSPLLSRNTALHTIEIRKSFTATHYQPMAFGEIEYLTALRSLSLECQALHGPLCCSSLEYLELIGAGGYMMLIWPDVSGCPRLTNLKLRNLPPAKPPKGLEQLRSLKNVQLTFAYMAFLNNRPVPLQYDAREHFDSINDLLDQLPGLPSLEALQIAAIQSNMAVNLGKAHADGLHHLALACRSLVILTGGSQGPPFDSPQSLHLLSRGTQDARTVQFLRSKRATVFEDERTGLKGHKIGLPNALDLDWDEVMEDVLEDSVVHGQYRLFL